MRTTTPPLQCPVCAANWRQKRLCPRCGADLAALMTLAHAAWQARHDARRALLEGKIEQAREWAAQSQSLHATPAGHRLRLLAAWLLARQPEI